MACPPLPTFWNMPASVYDSRGRRASKINQARKYSQQKVKPSDLFVCLDLCKQVSRQTPYSGNFYLEMLNNIFNLRHFRHLSQRG